MIYLDNAATTALSETAGKAMEPYFSDLYGNPSSSYRFGQEESNRGRPTSPGLFSSCLSARNLFYRRGDGKRQLGSLIPIGMGREKS